MTGGVNKLIFVGSPEIGAKVMEAAATTWHPTPVVLELGGKDPFIVCEDYKVTDDLVQVAVRGVFIHMGQNCAGPERFFVYESVYDEFVNKCAALVNKLELGDPLGSPTVDCGAVVMGERTKACARRTAGRGARSGRRRSAFWRSSNLCASLACALLLRSSPRCATTPQPPKPPLPCLALRNAAGRDATAGG